MGPTPKMDSEFEALTRRLAAAEQKIGELQESLDSSLAAKKAAELDSELNIQMAVEARQELQAFNHAIGHDLRGPLRSVLTYAQLIERRNPELVVGNEFFPFIIAGAVEMNVLVEALGNYARAGAQPRRSTVNLKLPVDLALLKLQPLIAEHRAEIIASDLPEVSIDESRFAIVFEHLITNAIRYRGEQAPKVGISTQQENGHILVAVEDNGIGIAPEYHKQVFEPLKRLHDKKISGMGLGLAICQKIARAHGGRMWVESDGQQGSTFLFTLPA